MHYHPDDHIFPGNIRVTDEVIAYIQERKCDFRICTTCGGPILLPVALKPPKPTDIQIAAGDYTIFISAHQVRYLHSIHMGLVPHLVDYEFHGRGGNAVRRTSAYGRCADPGESGDLE
ncbi:MAG: hypothetical protein LUQ25_01520 [Methanoregulaceae archaeon]|nr:hypothetical protein [Methanoregulaceae archaeon]